MKKPTKLIEEVMRTLIETTDSINGSLCEIIDSLTDSDNNPLEYVSSELVKALKDVAKKAYNQSETISEDSEALVEQVNVYYEEKQNV